MNSYPTRNRYASLTVAELKEALPTGYDPHYTEAALEQYKAAVADERIDDARWFAEHVFDNPDVDKTIEATRRTS